MRDFTDLLARDLIVAGATGVQVWHDERTGLARVLTFGIHHERVRDVVLWESFLYGAGPAKLGWFDYNPATGKCAIIVKVAGEGQDFGDYLASKGIPEG